MGAMPCRRQLCHDVRKYLLNSAITLATLMDHEYVPLPDNCLDTDARLSSGLPPIAQHHWEIASKSVLSLLFACQVLLRWRMRLIS